MYQTACFPGLNSSAGIVNIQNYGGKRQVGFRHIIFTIRLLDPKTESLRIDPSKPTITMRTHAVLSGAVEPFTESRAQRHISAREKSAITHQQPVICSLTGTLLTERNRAEKLP